MNQSHRVRVFLAGAAALVLAACGGAAAPSSSAAAPARSSAITSAAGAASASPSGLTKIKVAYSQATASQGVLYTAVEQKFFERYGLDVEAIQVGGPQQPPAMQAGEIQFGTPGGNELILANIGGVAMVMIASSTNVPVLSLYGAKGVNDVKDLAGKSVAVTQAGSATDAAAQIYLQHYGLDKQVKRQAAGTSQAILAVLERGEAAGGLFAPPTTIAADRFGMKELVNGIKLGDPFVQAGSSVTREFLKAKPDLVKRFLQGYYSSWKFTIDPANEAAVEQTMAKWTKSDMAAAKLSYDYLVPAWRRPGMPMVSLEGLKTIAAISQNPKAKDANLSEFVDNSFLEAIAAGR